MSILSAYKAGAKAGARTKALTQLQQLVLELKEVLADEELDWETKYDLVFDTHQKKISSLLVRAGKRLEYYDPDTTYEEDSRAYVNALEDLVS